MGVPENQIFNGDVSFKHLLKAGNTAKPTRIVYEFLNEQI